MIPALRWGSDESHFNVSVGSDGQNHKTVSTNHNLFEEKGEPKRYRTEVLPLTSLTPYRWATPAHSQSVSGGVSFIAPRNDLASTAQELCESRGGRPGLSVLTSLLVSVDVKIY